MTPRRIGAVQAHEGASAVPLPLWRDRSSRRQLTSRAVPLAVSMRAHARLLAPHHATTRAGHVDAGTLINRHHTKIQATHASYGDGTGVAPCAGWCRDVACCPTRVSALRLVGRCLSVVLDAWTSRPTRQDHPYDRRAASRAIRSHTRTATAIGTRYAPYTAHVAGISHASPGATASTYTAPLRGLRRNGSGRHPP